MLLAHRYRNTLTEIERGRRAALREVDARAGLDVATTAVAQARARAQAAHAAIKAYRGAARTTKVPEALSEELAAARAAEREASAAFATARQRVREDTSFAGERERIENCALDLIANARAHCGCSWGTYQLVEAAMQAARKAPIYERGGPNDPSFVRYEGGGDVSVQIRDNGFPEDDRWVRIVDRPVRTSPGHSGHCPDPHSKRSQSRPRKMLWLRVASEGHTPVWAKFPMVLSRPLPEGARIRRVTVSLRTIGPREEWSAKVILTEAPGYRREACGDGAVAVNLGWRSEGGGLRVATCMAEASGAVENFVLDAKFVQRLGRPAELRATRDKNFDAAREGLVHLLGREGALLPSWLRTATRSLAQWKSADRMAGVVRRWCEESELRVTHEDYLAWTPPAPDAWTQRDLAIWRFHDHHLWEWSTSFGVKVLRHRTARYRDFAVHLARRFGTLLVEAFDMRETADKSKQASENPHARSNRHMAAPSEMRRALVEAFHARGGNVVVLPAPGHTVRCHHCGHTDAWDPAKDLHHVCSQCGTRWDQDANNTANLLRAWNATGRAIPKPKPPRKKNPRKSRAKERRAQNAT